MSDFETNFRINYWKEVVWLYVPTTSILVKRGPYLEGNGLPLLSGGYIKLLYPTWICLGDL